MSPVAPGTVRAFLTALLPVAGLAACSENMTAPDPEPAPAPAPAVTTVYDLDLVTRYIDVRASCDWDLFGNSDPGEFQYKIEVSGAGQSYSQASRGYNTRTGETFQRNGGTTINFGNRTYVWRGLSRDAEVRVKLYGAEWDVLKDPDMANRSASVPVPFSLGTETRSLTIGADGNVCQIRLFYDATWTERQVEG